MSTPPTPLPDAHPSLWSVADDWVFLNPGSFGLRLQTVQARRGELLSQSESQPVEFLERTALPLHQQSLAWGVSKDVSVAQRADNVLRFEHITKN